MSNIILIQPKIGNLDSVNRHPALPLGLLSISRYISKDYNVKIIDQRINKNWRKELESELNKKPLFIALTVMNGPQLRYANQISKLIKKMSDIIIIWGGPHPTFYPESINNPYVDIIIRGEGEVTINELAKAIKSNTDLRKVEGISFKSKNDVIHNKQRPNVIMDSLPLIPLDIINLKKYIYNYKQNGKKISYSIFEASRGCTNDCHFCRNSANILSTNWRGFSAPNLFKRIRRLIDNFGINYFYFVDDNFFVNPNMIKSFCERVNKSKYKFQWIASGTVKKISCYSDEFYNELSKSGCKIIHIGLESGSQKLIDSMQKEKFKLSDVIKLNKRLRKYGIVPYYEILLGYYGETLDDIKKTIRLIFKLIKDNKDVQFSALHCLSLYENTKLYDFATKNKLLNVPSTNLESNDWSKAKIPWINKERKRLLERLYFCSLFIDNKHELVDSFLVRAFSKIYRPIALYRMKNLDFRLMFEHRLVHLQNIL